MDNSSTGLVMACLICLVPFVVGLLLGLWMQRRVTRYGMPGALLPRAVRNALERAAKEDYPKR